jgi:hypothetical protein
MDGLITLTQAVNFELEILNNEGVICINQYLNEIVVDKESIPDLINILQSFIEPKQNGKAQRNNNLP